MHCVCALFPGFATMRCYCAMVLCVAIVCIFRDVFPCMCFVVCFCTNKNAYRRVGEEPSTLSFASQEPAIPGQHGGLPEICAGAAKGSKACDLCHRATDKIPG